LKNFSSTRKDLKIKAE